MKTITRILRSPVSKTIIALTVSIAAYAITSMALFYVLRVMCADGGAEASCRGTNLQMFVSQFLDDMRLLTRIAAELSVIVLIAQLLYRALRMLKK